MTASLARRAGILLGIMLGAVLLVHTLVYLIPGDPAVMIAGDYASEQDISAIRSELSLNEPFFTRYLVYLSRLARLDMGKSIYTGAPVRALIADRFPATLGLALVSMAMAGIAGVGLGIISGIAPLYRSVIECSYSSAFRDPRFEPLARGEMNDISIEISVLTEPRVVRSPEEIVVGRDGIIIEMAGQRGLLLPQVAVEYGWTREEFLVHAFRKAGLPDNAWRNGARIYTFQALVFGEDAAT